MDNEEQIQSSPLPTSLVDQPMQYLFWDAMKIVAEGRKVTKLEWANPEIYGVMSEGKLCIHLVDGQLHPWILSDSDMAGDDFVVVEEN